MPIVTIVTICFACSECTFNFRFNEFLANQGMPAHSVALASFLVGFLRRNFGVF
jgi:hypothetical protein